MYPSTLRPLRDFGPVTVPEGSLFVMGDNRDNSWDSRKWGYVSRNKVKGRALLIYFSWDGHDHTVRWDRLGMMVP